jgi:hypothetical protein
MQKPVWIFSIAIQPIQGNRDNIIREFIPIFAGIVDFTETRIPMPGRVPLSEWANGRGLHTELGESIHPSRAAKHVSRVSYLWPLHERLRGYSPVIDNSGVESGSSAP